MTAVERRFLAGFREVDSDSPGLVQEDDGSIWLVAPDGTRTQLPGGGGSSAYPADATGTTVAVQTPDAIRGSDSAQWVKFPSDGTALAWGIAGDAFPRVIFGADPTDFGAILMGDGTIDPAQNGFYMYGGAKNDSGHGYGYIGNRDGTIGAGDVDANVGGVADSSVPLRFGGQTCLYAGPADPNAQVGGNAGDFFFWSNNDPALWTCTIAGIAGAATWVPVSGGGSIPSPQTADLTTDPNTFQAENIFDMGAPCWAVVTYHPTAFNGDGETFGGADGDIDPGLQTFTVSWDNVSYATAPQLQSVQAPNTDWLDLSSTATSVILIPRYFKAQVEIDDWTSSALYSGPNHPTMTVRVVVTPF